MTRSDYIRAQQLHRLHVYRLPTNAAYHRAVMRFRALKMPRTARSGIIRDYLLYRQELLNRSLIRQ